MKKTRVARFAFVLLLLVSQITLAQNLSDSAENQNKAPDLRAERKKIVDDRMRANMLSDSAYFFVGLLETQIRIITKNRDRGNRLSKTKQDESYLLSDDFYSKCNSLLSVSDEKGITAGLKQAEQKDIQYLTKQYQSDKANAISTVLGQQIIIKRAELEVARKEASKILSTSTTKTLDETEKLYKDYYKKYQEADTLVDCLEELNMISRNEVDINYEESAVFINLREYLQNQVKIENLVKTSSSDQIKLIEPKNNEAELLMEMGINNRKKTVKETSVLQQGYYIKDATTFEETAINLQLEILKMSGQKVTTTYKTPSSKTNPAKVVVPVQNKKTVSSKKVLHSINDKGLVYMVQLGAFGQSPSAEKLKGIDPVSTEEISGSTVKRYFGGNFSDKSDADQACQQYRKNGFSDAFVVAFNNGSKISVSEAKKLKASNSSQVTKPVNEPQLQKKQNI